MSKYLQIADVIRRRIHEGEYAGGELDGLRGLGTEFGVSYLTVRRSLHHLCDEGLLAPSNNKRFRIVTGQRRAPTGGKYGLLMPQGAMNAGFPDVIGTVVRRLDGSLKRHFYSYYQDPILASTLDGDFDLIFFLIDPRHINRVFLDRLVEKRARVVSLTFDYTAYGIRLLAEADIAASVRLLLELLVARGCRRLDILGIAHDNEIIASRIASAAAVARQLAIPHTALRRTVPEFSYEFDTATKLAAELYGGGVVPDGIFVPTVFAAMAVMRALQDRGCTAGKDYALVSCEDITFARHVIPSVTVSYTPDPTDLIAELVRRHSAKDFTQLVYKPVAPCVFHGESTAGK